VSLELARRLRISCWLRTLTRRMRCSSSLCGRLVRAKRLDGWIKLDHAVENLAGPMEFHADPDLVHNVALTR
jgi:hypothetical protein